MIENASDHYDSAPLKGAANIWLGFFFTLPFTGSAALKESMSRLPLKPFDRISPREFAF
jgi:hypothetical protein